MRVRIRLCIMKGSTVYKKTGDKWSKPEKTDKTLCGKIVRFARLGNDVRLSKDVAVVSVKGREYAAGGKGAKLKFL